MVEIEDRDRPFYDDLKSAGIEPDATDFPEAGSVAVPEKTSGGEFARAAMSTRDMRMKVAVSCVLFAGILLVRVASFYVSFATLVVPALAAMVGLIVGLVKTGRVSKEILARRGEPWNSRRLSRALTPGRLVRLVALVAVLLAWAFADNLAKPLAAIGGQPAVMLVYGLHDSVLPWLAILALLPFANRVERFMLAATPVLIVVGYAFLGWTAARGSATSDGYGTVASARRALGALCYAPALGGMALMGVRFFGEAAEKDLDSKMAKKSVSQRADKGK